jgi:hypothetical protein
MFSGYVNSTYMYDSLECPRVLTSLLTIVADRRGHVDDLELPTLDPTHNA